MNKKKILITGICGFLGSNLALELTASGYDVFGLGHRGENFDFIQSKIKKIVISDINIESIRSFNIQFDTIVHCGGSGAVSFSVINPEQDFNRSVLTTLYSLEYIRLFSPSTRFIYPSSPAVQGCTSSNIFRVQDPLNPVSPYGTHKKIAEDLCRSYALNYNLDYTIIRFFSIYGDGLQKQLIWDAVNKLSESNTGTVEFWGTGNETRDWIHVSDATELIRLVIEKATEHKILNCGAGLSVSIKDTVKLLANKLNADRCEISFNGKIKAGDPQHYLADISESLSLGWEPKVSLESGIDRYIKWFKGIEND
ncbi:MULTISPECIES: NAD-dependent epimerase/dehydratase family protein [Pectobacterium]|uniref:NAD-dependent epimerase/dehydratase family protein n=1 Tax=Pectobacterium TaxID=122277 RepID=UPI0010FDD0BD|nr:MULTISPECIES: NAD(P)-dependent oxidoreductase [Pectobacterium]KAA3667411.1 NAD(P)-dependent oxidoreductase [Pectobacterium carotovorum subsp. carotovorum]MCA6925180.1 NAD(P)-dependent oxidoreductase [Pectobacterium versatile]MCH5081940.1 NAD(P)-dependent oxidoreductase [Pectobacterium versatile]